MTNHALTDETKNQMNLTLGELAKEVDELELTQELIAAGEINEKQAMKLLDYWSGQPPLKHSHASIWSKDFVYFIKYIGPVIAVLNLFALYDPFFRSSYLTDANYFLIFCVSLFTAVMLKFSLALRRKMSQGGEHLLAYENVSLLLVEVSNARERAYVIIYAIVYAFGGIYNILSIVVFFTVAFYAAYMLDHTRRAILDAIMFLMTGQYGKKEENKDVSC